MRQNLQPAAGHHQQPLARPAAEPFVFSSTVALFEPARGDTRDIAVLFAASFGVEDLCSRRFFRILAERFADHGIASLRFDYPGTGDARTDLGADLAGWTGTLASAAAHLKSRSGITRLAIVAQGIGAPIATLAASIIPNLAAMVLMAPVTSGRLYGRELSAFTQVAAEKLALRPDIDVEAIARVSLPPSVAADLRGIDLLKLEIPPTDNILVFTRAERPSDGALAQHLQELGAAVTTKPFEGYDRLTINPLLAEVPEAVTGQTVEWVMALSPGPSKISGPAVAMLQRIAPSDSHTGDGYSETPLRFGRNDRLFGIACDPLDASTAKDAQVLLLAAGYERQSGWGSYSARLARKLANAGISSLRFDCSNVADSPAVEGHEGHVLYGEIQVADAIEAIDFMAGRSHAPIIAAGRCTGAWLAFQIAVRDPRITGMVGINPEMFIWPENRPIVSALTEQTQTLKHYSSRFLDIKTLKKALRGEINLARKGKAIGSRLKQHAMRPLSKAIGGISTRERAVYAAFENLQQRTVPVTILYSPGDIGLEEHAHFFKEGKSRYPAITTRTVPGTSHTFQHAHARTAYFDAIVRQADAASKTAS